HAITVQASGGTLNSPQTFICGIRGESPSTRTESDGVTGAAVSEGASNGGAVGITAASTDVHGGTVTYSLTGDTSGGGFTINSAKIGRAARRRRPNVEVASRPTKTRPMSDGQLYDQQSLTIGAI